MPVRLRVEANNVNFTMDEICEKLFSINTKLCIKGYRDEVFIQAGICVTQFDSSNLTVAGLCPYYLKHVRKFIGSNYISFPANMFLTELTNFSCGAYNREGRLCAKCIPGYGPAVYAFSLICAECSINGVVGWVLYLCLVPFPITVFYFIVIILNICATAPPFTAFVLMCQTYCMMELVYVPLKSKLVINFKHKLLLYLLQTVRVLCGFWNLDYFRFLVPPFCVSSHLSNMHALSLEYIHVMYPLVLILITFICVELHARNFTLVVVLWKPFHKYVSYLRRHWDPRASIINAFSTFLLLNLSKLVFVAGYCLWYTKLYIVSPTLWITNQTNFLYNDPTIYRYSKHHLPYLLCSVIFLVMFFTIPTLLLCLYPTKLFRSVVQCSLSLRWQQGMSAFIDTFQGHYKDGTNNTRDYRAASGIHLVVIFLMILISYGYTSSISERVKAVDYIQPILVAVSLFYALACPCKQKYANTIQSLLYALTAFVVLSISLIKSHNCSDKGLISLMMLLCLLTPHVVLYSHVTYKVTKRVGVNYYHLWTVLRNVCTPKERNDENCLLQHQPYPNERFPLLSKT